MESINSISIYVNTFIGVYDIVGYTYNNGLEWTAFIRPLGSNIPKIGAKLYSTNLKIKQRLLETDF